jgi:Xaa-Pro aminopeptidase
MKIPYNGAKLDAILDQAGVDLVLATSKENIQYLTGGYRFIFFSHKDAIGLNRYLPALGIPRGRPEKAFYVGNTMEAWQQHGEPLWLPTVKNASWSGLATAADAAAFIRERGMARGTIALEQAFFPADAFAVFRQELPEASLVEATPLLEELRAVKRPDEVQILKEAAEAIVDSMQAVMRGTPPGTTTREICERLRQEETRRGLNFEYLLVTAGPSFLRAPSDAKWRQGDILSLDSGGNKHGYIGDLARMAVLGRATPLMRDLLAEVNAVQMAARKAVRAGALGGAVFEAALAEQARCPHAKEMVFLAHGMGLVQHEAPHLTGTGFVPYPATHEKKPLEAGMVLSIETELKNPEIGYVKLEDAVVVTRDGWEAWGDAARDWVEVGA